MLDRSARSVKGWEMARPPSFHTEDAVQAAAEVFWSKGYQDTAIADLEQATGLNRSSLYGAFGTKQAIFDRALDWYLRGFIGPRLAGRIGPADAAQACDAAAACIRAWHQAPGRSRVPAAGP
jgi:AcrR family transcriptional regulator